MSEAEKQQEKAPRSQEEKQSMHPRNRHRLGYDFEALAKIEPSLKAYLAPNPHGGGLSLDYAKPKAVLALNKALLKQNYGVESWDLPETYLCPPIPGRADYLHWVADLLREDLGEQKAQGESCRVLDLGTGANLVFPILGRAEYGWSFVGSDVNREALSHAAELVVRNRFLQGRVDLRLQSDASRCLGGIVKKGENFTLSICNPPFHASAAEASAGTLRKLRNLGGRKIAQKVLNFGGGSSELWCLGGELGFLTRLIHESGSFAQNVLWFTSLVSKSANVEPLQKRLQAAGIAEQRLIGMRQGQKISRILAWTYFKPEERKRWATLKA